jgi:hypothetical protein
MIYLVQMPRMPKIRIMAEAITALQSFNQADKFCFKQLGGGAWSYSDGIKLTTATEAFLFTGDAAEPTVDVYTSVTTGVNAFILAQCVWDVTKSGDPRYWRSAVRGNYFSKTDFGFEATETLTPVHISTSTHYAVIGLLSTNEDLSRNGKYMKYTQDTTTPWGATSLVYYDNYLGWNLVLTDTESTEGVFSLSKRYYYKIALEYDLYQISPMFTSEPIAITLTGADHLVDIKVEKYTGSTISTRVTAVLVFRAESASTQDAPESLYRLVGRISTKDGWSLDTTQTATWGDRRYSRIYDYGNYGPTYETESGCPETLVNNTMDYAISCMGAGYHFVGQCDNDELEEIQNMVFRSKKNSPDAFDWSNDFCVLPTVPIALHYFKGYLYAFDTATMYVIDAENLVLIGKYEGFGVQSDLAIVSNEDYMCFANIDNICLHDGKNPIVISGPINQIGSTISGATSHRTLASARTIGMTMFSKFNSLVVGYFKYSASAEATQIFVFNFRDKAWYYWIANATDGEFIVWSTTERHMLFTDYAGQGYLMLYKGIFKLMGAATGKTATWYSKEINFGDDVATKKIYKVDINGTPTTKLIGYDGTTPATAFTSNAYLPFTNKRRTVQLGFTLASGTFLKGISIIWRALGLR